MLRVWGSLLKFGFPLLISLTNALPHSTIACNVSYFQYLKGCKTVLYGKFQGALWAPKQYLT